MIQCLVAVHWGDGRGEAIYARAEMGKPNKGMVLVKLTLGMGLMGRQEAVIEVDEADLEGKNPEEVEAYLTEYWQDWIWNYIDGGAEIVEGD